MSTNTKKNLGAILIWFVFISLSMGQEGKPTDPAGQGDQEGISINTVDNMELSAFIKMLSVQYKVNIISLGPLTGTASVNLFNVSLEMVLDAVLKPNGYDYKLTDGIYLVMKVEELAALDTPFIPQVTRIFRLNYLNVDDAKKFIEPLLSDKGKLIVGETPAEGIPTGAGETGGDSNASFNVVLVQDREDLMPTIEETIQSLDVRPLQVLVEATILEAILDDSSTLGVDFNALGGIDFSDVNSTWNVSSMTVDDATGGQLDDTLIGARDTGFASDDPTEGLSFSILHDEVAIFIEAIENVTDTNVIANPKVLALNYQRAEIIIGGRLGYFGASTISDGLSQQSVEFLETGTQLRFRPFISTDGYIRLEIHPQRSDGVVDPITGLPSENTSEVTTNIMVKDGDTVVIGGLIEETDQRVESRVPFFGTIPIIGWLFRRTETKTRRVEIIVMITPRIIDPANDDRKAEEHVLEFQQRKQLFRDGFLFCSRTIYAERHVAKARSSFQEGDLGWARYHINRAAYLDPHNDELVPLKNRIEEASSREEETSVGMEEFLRSELE